MKANEMDGLALLDIKFYYKVRVIKVMFYQYQVRQTDQCLIIEAYLHDKWTFDLC